MTAPGTAFENKIANVGQLFQADRQTFIYQAASAPSQLPLLAMLRQVNRSLQLEQLAEAVDEALASQRTSPLVVLVKGAPEDELMSFVQRVGEHDLADEMLLQCDYLGQFAWPERSFQRLLTGLISAIARARGAAMPPRAAAQESLIELIAGNDRSIVIAHQLDPARCMERPELLDAWTKLIAETCRNPINGLLVCFLCVELCEPGGDACQWLLDSLGRLCATHGWCDLDLLGLVEPRHVEDWIDLYNLKPALVDLAYISPAIASDVFGTAPRLRYRNAVEGVLGALGPMLRPFQPRWAA